MKYVISPEFNRNLWLRFSPFSLIAAPVLLCLIAFVCINSGGANAATDAGMGVLANVMLSIFFIVVIVAGNYEAGTALQDEVRNNTWDFQRMSSISAAKLAFGKLFGATSYHWYFGLLTLGFFSYGYQNFQQQTVFNRFSGYNNDVTAAITPDNSLPALVVYMVLAALIGHVLAFVSGFYDMMSTAARGGTRGRTPKGVNAFILGLICSSYIFSTITMQAATHLQRGRLGTDAVIKWLGGEYPASLFIPFSLLFFLGWFLVGAYRLARAELMHSQAPTAWVGFVCSAVFWFTGFMHPGGELSVKNELGYFGPLMIGFIAMAIVTYFTMMNESNDLRRYARFWNYLQLGQIRRMLENTPKWMTTAPITIGLYVVFMLYSAGLTAQGESRLAHFGCLFLSMMLFMVRDGFAVHSIHLGVRRRGAGFVILFYFAITYIILPMVAFAAMGYRTDKILDTIFSSRLGTDIGASQMLQLAGFFFPTFTGDPSVSVFPALLQTGIAAGLLFWLLGKRKAAATPKVTETNG